MRSQGKSTKLFTMALSVLILLSTSSCGGKTDVGDASSNTPSQLTSDPADDVSSELDSSDDSSLSSSSNGDSDEKKEGVESMKQNTTTSKVNEPSSAPQQNTSSATSRNSVLQFPSNSGSSTKPYVKKTIMFTGDSITDAHRTENEDTIRPGNLGTGHAKKIDEYYKKKYGAKAHTILNSGRNGNTLSALKARFQTDIVSFNPEYLVVLIGVNDATYVDGQFPGYVAPTAAEYKQQYVDFVKNYLKGFEKVVVISPFLLEQSGAQRTRVESIAAVVKEAVNENSKSIQLIDGQALFDAEINKVGWENAGQYRNQGVDPVHLSDKGYDVLTAAVLEQLEK